LASASSVTGVQTCALPISPSELVGSNPTLGAFTLLIPFLTKNLSTSK
jgi:hypothetical protein